MESYEKTVKAISDLSDGRYPEEGLEHLDKDLLVALVNGIPQTGIIGPKVMQHGEGFKLGYMIKVVGSMQGGFSVGVPSKDELDRLGREYGFDTSNIENFVNGLEGRDFDYGKEDIPKAAEALKRYFIENSRPKDSCRTLEGYVDTFRHSGSAQIGAQLQLRELALATIGYEIVDALASSEGVRYLVENY